MTRPWDPLDRGVASPAQLRVLRHPTPPGIRLVGELDLATHQVLRGALRELDREPGDLRIDVGELEFIDSTAVAELVRFSRRRRPQRVIIESPSRLLLRIVDALFDVADFIVE